MHIKDLLILAQRYVCHCTVSASYNLPNALKIYEQINKCAHGQLGFHEVDPDLLLALLETFMEFDSDAE